MTNLRYNILKTLIIVIMPFLIHYGARRNNICNDIRQYSKPGTPYVESVAKRTADCIINKRTPEFPCYMKLENGVNENPDNPWHYIDKNETGLYLLVNRNILHVTLDGDTDHDGFSEYCLK